MGMSQSNIGYRGIGADGQPVDWYYGWNPFGFGCSANCPGCWSKAMCHRVKCPDCAAFRVHVHPERMEQPAQTRKPGVVLCNFTNDWLDRAAHTPEHHRGDEPISQIIDMMRLAPQHHYVTLTKNASWATYWQQPVNEWRGLTLRTQVEADAKLNEFVGWSDGKIWLSLEPLWGPITLPMKALKRLSGVIVGHDNRPGTAGTNTLDHVRSVVQQCKAAGVPCYVKQLWVEHITPGRKFLSKEPADFPTDLQLRNLPWSMPKGL